MPNIIAYIRVSTQEQADSGLGLEAQLAAIQKTIGKPDTVFSDPGKSGSDPDRPGLFAALDNLRRGDKLAVAKLDRLSRDKFLFAFIEKEVSKAKAEIISAAGEGTQNNDPCSLLMRDIVQAFARYERKIIALRTSVAMKAAMKRGQYIGGGRPIGFEINKNGKLIPNPTEQQIIKRVYSLKSKGLSLRKIAKRLHREKLTSRILNPKTVKKMLERFELIAA